MKVFLIALGCICLFAGDVSAQWGGFLDPNIIRKAGEDAATGNVSLGNVSIDGRDPRQVKGNSGQNPTAAEIAYEIRKQEADERQAKIRLHLSQRWQADYVLIK
jgi:hypothetical protein